MKRFMLLVVLVFSISGCMASEEYARKVLGVSTEDLEVRRSTGIKKNFDMDFDSCFERAQEVLKDIDAYIYARQKWNELIAIYRTEKDTTPVGVFFSAVSGKVTEVEVVSPSSFIAEEVSQKLFLGLEGKPIPVSQKEIEELEKEKEEEEKQKTSSTVDLGVD